MANQSDHVSIGVIGCGRWGPNHIRVFSELEQTSVLACADPNEKQLATMARRFKGLQTTTEYRSILDDPAIDAVVVATPTDTHAEITQQALHAGKHVLVEKPISANSQQAKHLAQMAKNVGRVLMVGHVFLYNNGIAHLRELVESGQLGRIHYLDAARTNLGPIRGDVNALYDLATHDISIFNYLAGQSPVEVSATGSCITQSNIEDVCFATLKYPDGMLGHIHVSWLNPRKVRTMTVVGEQRMADWDDLNALAPVRVYDKGLAEMPHYDSFGEFKYLLRSGDVRLPAVSAGEPLVNQAKAFLAWITDGQESMSDAEYGRQVLLTLEACQESIKANGKTHTLKQTDAVVEAA